MRWFGGDLRSLIQRGIDNGSFAEDYPQMCTDRLGPIGTNRQNFFAAMQAEIRDLPDGLWTNDWVHPTNTTMILDILVFCWWHIAEPNQDSYHDYFDHYHLLFDPQVGRQQFTEDINRIFRRNGLAYHLVEPRQNNQGLIERLGPPVLRGELATAQFNTGDVELNHILEAARLKFLNPA